MCLIGYILSQSECFFMQLCNEANDMLFLLIEQGHSN